MEGPGGRTRNSEEELKENRPNDQRRAKLPGSAGKTSTAPTGFRHVVSTRMPVRATIRSTMVARIAMAVWPNSDERVEPLGAAVVGVVSTDTVLVPVKSEGG
jgi:hypothetical protein